jgi:hypothetical protein|tara:strand:+ start:728 stop:1459 length:732 start_codon:yes stop_codon:yes gene_type:complete
MSKQLNEVDFVVIDPRGNIKPAGMKIQASMYAKKMGGPRKGYFVIPKKNAKKAQKLYGKFGANISKLQEPMFDLMYETYMHELLEAATPENAPAYFKGLSKKEKDERERVIKRRSKMKSGDPDAYKPFRTDKGKKTKPSSSTLKFKKMFGELNEEEQQLFAEKLSAKIRKSLKKKAEKANAPMGALTTIYNKGLAAWRTGHRPGASQHAWAMARVNSVLTGGKARKVDAAQWKQISKHRKKKK